MASAKKVRLTASNFGKVKSDDQLPLQQTSSKHCFMASSSARQLHNGILYKKKQLGKVIFNISKEEAILMPALRDLDFL